MSAPTDAEIKEAEAAIKEAEQLFGFKSIEVAERLERCARLLRQVKSRGLDVANMEARAKVIRSEQVKVPDALPQTKPLKSETGTKKCPFCAEIIQKEAVLCRFCKKELKAKPAKPNAIGLAPLVLAIAVFAWMLFANPGNSVLNAIMPKSKISGAAWVTKSAGQSEIQRGMEIALCNESVAVRIAQTKQEIDRQVSETDNPSTYLGLGVELPSFSKVVAREAVKIAKTDIDGKYIFTDVLPGKYYLYAAYANDFSVAYWLLPIEVGIAQEMKVDLDNGNMAAVYNKND